MQLLGIEWEKVSTKKRSRNGNGGSSVYLSKTAKGGYSRMNLSAELTATTGWQTEDRVTLYKQGTKLFLLKRETVGLLTMKGQGRQLYINNADACRSLYPTQNGDKFEATYDKDIDAVILMPARQ